MLFTVGEFFIAMLYSSRALCLLRAIEILDGYERKCSAEEAVR